MAGLSFLFLAVIPAIPQQSSAAPSTGRRVALDVVVTDKSGAAVPGLQQADFTILDNKLPNPITEFRAIGQTAQEGDPPVEVILLMDRVNTSFTVMSSIGQQLMKYLHGNGGQLARPVSIVVVSDNGYKLIPVSRDGNALATELDQTQSGLRQITRGQGVYGAVERLQISLDTLRKLSESEAQVPGRKLLIWISPGWPILSGPRIQLTKKDQALIFASVVAASDELRRARITLYSVDPLGVSDAGSVSISYYREFLKGVTSERQSQFGNLALQVLATQSGGQALNSSNDMGPQIERCLSDLTSWYAISFNAPPSDGPNEYHALQVKTDKPGTAARTRTGYYDQP